MKNRQQAARGGTYLAGPGCFGLSKPQNRNIDTVDGGNVAEFDAIRPQNGDRSWLGYFRYPDNFVENRDRAANISVLKQRRLMSPDVADSLLIH
jgi:hypothetical protein